MGANDGAARPNGHPAGILAVLWACVALVEWYWVLATTADEGPVPHLAHAPRLVVLQMGAAMFVLVVVLGRSRLRLATRVLYVLPVCAYLWISLLGRI
ncbi:MAG: hypothetical protein GY711_03320 [bacterium]|nr:hypothetical protein [bacterium]